MRLSLFTLTKLIDHNPRTLVIGKNQLFQELKVLPFGLALWVYKTPVWDKTARYSRLGVAHRQRRLAPPVQSCNR